MINQDNKLSRPKKLLTPTQLRVQIKNKAKEYLDWMRKNSDISIPEDRQLLSDKYDFVFRRIVQKAGLKRIRLHDLRHTYATLQRKAGQPIEVISRVLGHTSEIVTLTVYNHWEGDLRAPADTMDLMLEKISQDENKETSVRNPLEDDEGSVCRP